MRLIVGTGNLWTRLPTILPLLRSTERGIAWQTACERVSPDPAVAT
jgi:hypothetical protein